MWIYLLLALVVISLLGILDGYLRLNKQAKRQEQINLDQGYEKWGKTKNYLGLGSWKDKIYPMRQYDLEYHYRELSRY